MYLNRKWAGIRLMMVDSGTMGTSTCSTDPAHQKSFVVAVGKIDPHADAGATLNLTKLSPGPTATFMIGNRDVATPLRALHAFSRALVPQKELGNASIPITAAEAFANV